MNIDDIIQRREELENKLNLALATFEKKSVIRDIHLEILQNQEQCPHISDKYNWKFVDGLCPYCGRKIY